MRPAVMRISRFYRDAARRYDTEIGNRGVKLSGGEKQRLSIARAILKNPHIMILDEATSSLDSISESDSKPSGRCLRGADEHHLIAHRLSTVLFADGSWS